MRWYRKARDKGSSLWSAYALGSGKSYVSKARYTLTSEKKHFSTHLPRVIRLMNEYSVTWPLWDEKGMLPDGDPPLSDELTQRLHAWAKNFNDHFDEITGWPTREDRVKHRREAEALVEAIQHELGSTVEVRLEFWEEKVAHQT